MVYGTCTWRVLGAESVTAKMMLLAWPLFPSATAAGSSTETVDRAPTVIWTVLTVGGIAPPVLPRSSVVSVRVTGPEKPFSGV